MTDDEAPDDAPGIKQDEDAEQEETPTPPRPVQGGTSFAPPVVPIVNGRQVTYEL